MSRFTPDFQEYIQEKKNIYDNLIKFLESNDNNEENFKKLYNNISLQEQDEPQENLEEFLQLIVSIANNYHRSESFFNKIFQIIDYFGDQIKRTFKNIKIFNIFASNKKLLLFLFKKGIVTINNSISTKLLSKIDPNGNQYCHFFYPEIKNFIGEEKSKSIEKELLDKDSNIFDRFEENREEGENDTFLCSLIRKDHVEEFISYMNQTNLPLNIEIKPSIFETNSFLNEKKSISIIEYASFFGSIQIFQYLIMNKVELKPSLWLYAIHSQNAELISLLVENKIDRPKFDSDEETKYNNCLNCFCESIKCHYNEFACYIEDNFLVDNNDKILKNEKVLSCIMQFHNYAYFPSDLESEDEFYYLCSNNYHKLANLFIKKKEESIKKKITAKIYIFMYL